MKKLSPARVLGFSKVLLMLGGALLAILYLHNRETLGIPGAIAAESQQRTDLDKLPETTESSTNDLTPIVRGDSSEENDPLSQVTSVSQLSDVQPTDWAFRALQSFLILAKKEASLV